MKHFNLNTKGRDFFVGDMHGEFDLFVGKLHHLGFDFNVDRCFSVGDLIDRGPKSRDCLMLLEEPWFFAVMGNHEAMMIDPACWRDWRYNGGVWGDSVTNEDLLFLHGLIKTKMPYTMTVQLEGGVVGVVHAESAPNWEDNPIPDANTWDRDLIYSSNPRTTSGVDLVVCGHTVRKKPKRVTNHLFIDTGAVYNGTLTLVEGKDLWAM